MDFKIVNGYIFLIFGRGGPFSSHRNSTTVIERDVKDCRNRHGETNSNQRMLLLPFIIIIIIELEVGGTRKERKKH